MSDPVPAISEASATGAVAEIFSDIRTVLGVEVVNLIWRHLATIPDALPWAWGMLRPLYADGTIRAEAQALHTRIALPHLPPFPHDLLAAVGLGGDDLASIRNILAAYDRTNAMALIALSALLCGWTGCPLNPARRHSALRSSRRRPLRQFRCLRCPASTRCRSRSPVSC
jgi:hypothetical protein